MLLQSSNPFAYKNKYGIYSLDWEVMKKTRVNDNHVLTPVYREVNDLVDGEIAEEGKILTPLYQALAYVNGMHHDLFNNGGGNECFWGKTSQFKKCLRQGKLPKDAQEQLVRRLKYLISHMCRGRYFAWPREENAISAQICCEDLLIDTTYFIAKALDVDSLKVAEAQLKTAA